MTDVEGVDNLMNKTNNPKLKPYAQKLRREMTKEERHLWYDFLRTYPVRFLRQKVIDWYIVDFYCHSARLIIELDGSQHYEAQGLLRDRIRTERIDARQHPVLLQPQMQSLILLRMTDSFLNRGVQHFV